LGLVWGDDGRLQGGGGGGGGGGGRSLAVKNACCPPFSSSEMDLSLPHPTLLLSFTLPFAVSLCNENLSLIEGAAASWPRAAGLDCDTGYVTVMLIEVADQ